MPKAHLRYRPLSALPLAERVVFRGFAYDLERYVNDLDAYSDTRNTFERELLEDERNFSHFGLADVSSFYRYVPHDVLHRRITETTGRADLADGVRGFLRRTMNADVGVPQNVGPSDQFADLAITPIERRLVRQGFAVTRYNDDFRIGGSSNRRVRHGIEALQNELYAIGLTLNDSKSVILLRDGYQQHVDQLDGDEYEDGNEIGDEPSSPTQLKNTKAMLRAGLKKSPRARTRLQEVKALSDVRRALRRLTRWDDPYALRRGQAIVNRYPSLTQHYGRYCAALVDAGGGKRVAGYLESDLRKFILTPWQEMWLLQPIIAGAEPVGPDVKAWIQRLLLLDFAPMLRARAGLAAAHAGFLDARTAGLLVETSPEAARPDAIRAFALVHDGSKEGRKALAGLPDSQLADWIYGL